MSHFSFLQREWPAVFEAAGRAEGAVHADPRTACFYARQTLAMEWLLERGEMRIEDLEGLCPGVHRRSLQRDLQALVDRRLTRAEGAARTTRYVIRGDLP